MPIQATKTMTSNKSSAGRGQRQTMRKIALSFVVFLSLPGFACRGNEETKVNVNKTASKPERKVDDFQEILKSYRTAGFKFIFAFRRFDGDVFSGEDKKFLKDNSPTETNRWNLTEDGKIAVAGSNYKFPPVNLEALKLRFTVEDYSTQSGDSGDKNTNGNQNSNSVK